MQLSLLGVSAFALMGATPVIAVPTKANSFTVDVVPSFYISTLAPYVATFNCINDCLDGADCAAFCLNKGHGGDYKREPLKWPNFENMFKNIPNFVDTGVCITKCDGQDVCINRCVTARTPGKLAVVPDVKDLPLQIPNMANGIFRVSKCNWNVDCMASAVYSMVTVPGHARNGSRLAQRSEDISSIGIREDGSSASSDTTHVAVPRDVVRNDTRPAGVTKRQDKRGERFSHNVTPILSRSANVTTSYRQEILDRLARHKPELDAINARCKNDIFCLAREFPDYLRRDSADRWRLEKISGECGFVLECIEKELGKNQKYLEDLKKEYTAPEDKKEDKKTQDKKKEDKKEDEKKEDTPAESTLRKTPIQQPPLREPFRPGAAVNGTQPPLEQPLRPQPPLRQPLRPGAVVNGTQTLLQQPLRPGTAVNGTQPPLQQPLRPGAAVNGTQPPLKQPPSPQPPRAEQPLRPQPPFGQTPSPQPPRPQPPRPQPPLKQPPLEEPPLEEPPLPEPPLPEPPLREPPLEEPPLEEPPLEEPPSREPLHPPHLPELPHWPVNGTQPRLQQTVNGTQPPLRQPLRPGEQPHWTVNGTQH